MSPVSSTNDRAAKDGKIKSHRWLGANTAAPLFYDQTKQVEETIKFLSEKVVELDLFAVRGGGADEDLTVLDENSPTEIKARAGDTVTIEVVVSNRRAAHSLPPEVRDLYEPWVEFEAFDARGEKIFHSGFLNADKSLDSAAHVYKTIILDDHVRPITRHQIFKTRVKAYDNALPAGRSDIARYHVRLPASRERARVVILRARFNYRRFVQDYTEYVTRRQNKPLTIPIVLMAERETKITLRDEARQPFIVKAKFDASASTASNSTDERLARRWNDYGIGLLEQAQYGAAAHAFRRAAELNPKDADPLISAAVAEMRTERFAPEREQFTKAARLIEAALQVNPSSQRARFYQSLIFRAQGKTTEAAAMLTELAAFYPRDREVQRALGQTLFALGSFDEARRAFEAIISIDQTDANAYEFLASLAQVAGNAKDAARYQSLFLLWRDDPLAAVLAARFFAANPNWAEERVASHAHGTDSPPRPVLTGIRVTPDH